MTEKQTWNDFYTEAVELHKQNPHNLCKAYATKADMHTELVEALEVGGELLRAWSEYASYRFARFEENPDNIMQRTQAALNKVEKALKATKEG